MVILASTRFSLAGKWKPVVERPRRYIDLPQANFASPGHKGSSLPGYRAEIIA